MTRYARCEFSWAACSRYCRSRLHSTTTGVCKGLISPNDVVCFAVKCIMIAVTAKVKAGFLGIKA
jgi:hypothetical protein